MEDTKYMPYMPYIYRHFIKVKLLQPENVFNICHCRTIIFREKLCRAIHTEIISKTRIVVTRKPVGYRQVTIMEKLSQTLIHREQSASLLIFINSDLLSYVRYKVGLDHITLGFK